MSDDELAPLAARQLADYDNRTPGTVFADPGFSLSIDDAYRLQLAVAQLRQERGERVAGYKIGCVSPATQQQIGIDHPVVGHVWAGEFWESPAEIPADHLAGPWH